jgi:hypothetical protein
MRHAKINPLLLVCLLSCPFAPRVHAVSLPGDLTLNVPIDNTETSAPWSLTMRLVVGDQRHIRLPLVEAGSPVSNSRFSSYTLVLKNADSVTLTSRTMAKETPAADGYVNCTLASSDVTSAVRTAALVATSSTVALRIVAGWWKVEVQGIKEP